jgi:FkbM family methyltransferase
MEYGHQLQNDRWIVEAVFPGLRDGYFIEAGACGGAKMSASYVLEHHLGWNGICVEPVDKYFETLQRSRSCAKDHRCLAGRTGDFVEFLSYNEDLARSGIQSLNNNDLWAAKHDAHSHTTTKETVTLHDLLEQHGAPQTIEFLCLDVEGAERTILDAFDFDGEHRILAISIEGKSCDDLLEAKGYRQVLNPYAPRKIDHYFLCETLAEQRPDLLTP